MLTREQANILYTQYFTTPPDEEAPTFQQAKAEFATPGALNEQLIDLSFNVSSKEVLKVLKRVYKDYLYTHFPDSDPSSKGIAAAYYNQFKRSQGAVDGLLDKGINYKNLQKIIGEYLLGNTAVAGLLNYSTHEQQAVQAHQVITQLVKDLKPVAAQNYEKYLSRMDRHFVMSWKGLVSVAVIVGMLTTPLVLQRTDQGAAGEGSQQTERRLSDGELRNAIESMVRGNISTTDMLIQAGIEQVDPNIVGLATNRRDKGFNVEVVFPTTKIDPVSGQPVEVIAFTATITWELADGSTVTSTPQFSILKADVLAVANQ